MRGTRSLARIAVAGVAALSLAVVLAGCGGGDDSGSGGEADGVITINWGSEPPSLDPGLATDTTSSNVLGNIMDGLITLEGEDLTPTPALAESWDIEGKTVTFHMSNEGRWTNGDPVTAEDFEYSWKRTISPDLAADYAYQFYGVVGASEYNACKQNCDAMRDKVGIEAVDPRTLRVELTMRLAESLGIDAPFSCRAGVCSTCLSTLVRGDVEYFEEPLSEPGPGEVLLCCSRPKTTVEVDV